MSSSIVFWQEKKMNSFHNAENGAVGTLVIEPINEQPQEAVEVPVKEETSHEEAKGKNSLVAVIVWIPREQKEILKGFRKNGISISTILRTCIAKYIEDAEKILKRETSEKKI